MSHWSNNNQAQQAVTAAYQQVLTGNMKNLLVNNRRLSVQALGFQCFGNERVGVLITPWCMNLMLLPGEQSSWLNLPPGRQFQHDFPYGSFIFTVARLPGLDLFAQCSLFSPMHEFDCQEAAFAAGEAALNTLLASPIPTAISRRALLHGHLR